MWNYYFKLKVDSSIFLIIISNKEFQSLNSELFKFEVWKTLFESEILMFEFWKVIFEFRKIIIKAIIKEIIRKIINDKIARH